MDAFSCALDARNFKKVPYGSNNFNHLLYDDDVLIFGLASVHNANYLQESLSNFTVATQLYFHNYKHVILFSSYTLQAVDICLVLGFSHTKLSLKYLGLPIFSKKFTNAHFLPLLSRIFAFIYGWKVKLFSFAGRVQFLRRYIANMLAY